ncbi:MAG: hypothetical protein COT81_05610 [Candidatus Buchananbacteria bacterium CG10_big_fil_rev_8_21_14_0_10_42_9]|uniref:RNA polymerase subunit sigma-24 n=1 Tax=Candidatus Buchananbacteria bacterium CG10_big_fil_rev_8_21_14_0_10_42_9 TaxID=1974526 RepID=A0A2H0VZU1_9BACT|nr:MAG: hypothetical protein COT81_05610 [Candidatus Buchananbacteria bacterium CG10_big_fil_rev_8_21_14_0_10_42_9]
METSELQAIQECQQGKLDSFGALYDLYIKKIYNFIYYKTLHKETAEDLTSKTFIKALDKIGTFKIDQGTFSAWIYQIARNNVIDYYRSQKQEIDIEDVWDLSAKPFKAEVEAKMELEKVQKYIQGIPSEQREIIILRVWEGLSYKEIADIVGKNENNCKVIYSRAMSKLRQQMPLSLLLIFLLNV